MRQKTHGLAYPEKRVIKYQKRTMPINIPLFSLFSTLNPSFNELSIFIFNAEPVASIYSKCWLVFITVYIYCSDLDSSLAFSSFMWGLEIAWILGVFQTEYRLFRFILKKLVFQTATCQMCSIYTRYSTKKGAGCAL